MFSFVPSESMIATICLTAFTSSCRQVHNQHSSLYTIVVHCQPQIDAHWMEQLYSAPAKTTSEMGLKRNRTTWVQWGLQEDSIFHTIEAAGSHFPCSMGTHRCSYNVSWNWQHDMWGCYSLYCSKSSTPVQFPTTWARLAIPIFPIITFVKIKSFVVIWPRHEFCLLNDTFEWTDTLELHVNFQGTWNSGVPILGCTKLLAHLSS